LNGELRGWLDSRVAGQPTLLRANPRALQAVGTGERIGSDMATSPVGTLTQQFDNFLRLPERKDLVSRPVAIELNRR
jgi:hypothetical protein